MSPRKSILRAQLIWGLFPWWTHTPPSISITFVLLVILVSQFDLYIHFRLCFSISDCTFAFTVFAILLTHPA